MAKHQWLNPHQKGIVRRYYEHRDSLMVQKLGEIVSELYTCESEAKAAGLWKAARTALLNLGVHEGRADGIVDDRDLGRLARLLEELF